ncbi:MAG: hypothetical protein SH809_03175, partial [Rhodothermales bacterium]|nr:hypothetical protein [Rhodothermales bacterium]
VRWFDTEKGLLVARDLAAHPVELDDDPATEFVIGSADLDRLRGGGLVGARRLVCDFREQLLQSVVSDDSPGIANRLVACRLDDAPDLLRIRRDESMLEAMGDLERV